MDEKQKARDALIKRAIGYSVSEEAEEYSMVDGVLSLVKKKVSSKQVPPEISAIKLILEQNDADYSSFSEDELKKEKERLIKILQAKSRSKKNKNKEHE